MIHKLAAIVTMAWSATCLGMDCGLHLNEAVLKNYVDAELLIEPVVTATALYRLNLRSPLTYSPAARAIFENVSSDLAMIEFRLKTNPGSDPALCPFDDTVTTPDGYEFRRHDHRGRHVIVIRHPSRNFHWTVGINYEGNFRTQGNGVRIFKYFHVNTNGRLTDIEDALAATQHLFPRLR